MHNGKGLGAVEKTGHWRKQGSLSYHKKDFSLLGSYWK
jgi:hypothetical protein